MAKWVRIGLPGEAEWWYTAADMGLFISSDFCVHGWSTMPGPVVAGPFDTLEAAKAALLMLSEKA